MNIIVSYVDDTIILFQADSLDELYQLAEKQLKVVQRLSPTLLSLNVDKIKFIVFSSTVQEKPGRKLSFIKLFAMELLIVTVRVLKRLSTRNNVRPTL